MSLFQDFALDESRQTTLIVISYIIAVVAINEIGEGKVLPSTGQARFKCEYTCVVMKPFKGEVVDAKVVNVNKASLFGADASVGMAPGISSYRSLHADSQMGFFAMVGPLQVFVSSHVSAILSVLA